MKHSYKLQGFGYGLRPAEVEDAEFIVSLRTSNDERNRFVHAFTIGIEEEKKWLEHYYSVEGDYLFIIYNVVTGEDEGLIAIYHQDGKKAEWGRWSTLEGSLAATESVLLLYRIAFEQMRLDELYCLTNMDNKAVVSFHDSSGELFRRVVPNLYHLDGKNQDAAEHYSNPVHFVSELKPRLEKLSIRIMKKNIKEYAGEITFDHLGIATKSIEKEIANYLFMGYQPEGFFFEDSEQGVRGVFLELKNHPKIELLENLPGCSTLNNYIKTNNKIYHRAYLVTNIENAIDYFRRNKARVISPLKKSVYFKKRICFVMLPNMELIELIER